MNKTEGLLTAAEVASHFRVRPSTVKSWAREGRIPAVRFTRRVIRFDLDAIRRVLASAGGAPKAGAE